jgi:DNA-binding CsgD family transcriptional regulator
MQKGGNHVAAEPPRVTERESQVLNWVAAGKSDWAIGQILNISGKTVNFHVENAKRKFGVGTRIQAVIAAMREGRISRQRDLPPPPRDFRSGLG